MYVNIYFLICGNYGQKTYILKSIHFFTMQIKHKIPKQFNLKGKWNYFHRKFIHAFWSCVYTKPTNHFV